MSILLLILIILLVVNFAGGRAIPAYGNYSRYHYSWGLILLIILLLYLFGYR